MGEPDSNSFQQAVRTPGSPPTDPSGMVGQPAHGISHVPSSPTPAFGLPPGTALDRTTDLGADANKTIVVPRGKRVGVGTVLRDRYRLDSWIGGGGQGEVYRATDLELESIVAIKVLPEEISREKSAITRLKREALNSQSLSHPNVVRLFTFEQETPAAASAAGGGGSGAVFLVMQLIDGRSLAEILADKPEGMPPAKVIAIARPIADAIDTAHALRPPLLHRDLKPANILLSRDERPFLADFGIAFEVHSSMSQVSGMSHRAGTPRYMSPQHVEGERPTASDDIYSFGITLYEMLSGTPPFSHGDVFSQIKTKMPPPLSFLSNEANRALLSAVAKRAEDRPATASEYVQRLASALGLSFTGSGTRSGTMFGSLNAGITINPGASGPAGGSPSSSGRPTGQTTINPDGRRHGLTTEARAESGDPGAALILAERARKGADGPIDYPTAVRWYRRAAESGDAIALTRLAECLDAGLGTTVDKVQSTALLRKAAEGGYAPAQHRLGNRLLDGIGVDPDPAAGVKWLTAAARNANADAMRALARCYGEGVGVPRDLDAADMWLERAGDRPRYKPVVVTPTPAPIEPAANTKNASWMKRMFKKDK